MHLELCFWVDPGSTSDIRVLGNAWASFDGVDLDLELDFWRSQALEWIKIGFLLCHLLHLGGEINWKLFLRFQLKAKILSLSLRSFPLLLYLFGWLDLE